LSIDGGGMQGIIPCHALAYLEEAFQKKNNNLVAQIAEYFDITVGTSTGGILTMMFFTTDKNGKPLFTNMEIHC